MTQLGFVINLDTCMDLRGCMTNCKKHNEAPIGIYNLECFTNVQGSYPESNCYFIPLTCQQCTNPSCVPSCPEDVLAKDDQGIIVITDAGRCISCTQKPCVAACPYGAIDVDSKTGRIHKCDMCKDLIADNKSPACIAGCLINSWFYGDLNDPDSLVSQLLESWSGYTHQLKPQSGNQPNVHFLLSKKQWNDMDGFYSQNWHE